MSSKKLRAVIVGYGKMGQIRHAAMDQHGGYELIGICETGPLKSSVPVTKDLDSLLELRPDVLFCCAPNRFIPGVVCRSLDNGLHVFSEKPPGRNSQDVGYMRRAELRNPGLTLKFGFNHRYHDAIEDAKALIDSGALGRLNFMRGVYGKAGGSDYDVNWRNNPEFSGGGILIDQGIHMLDLFHLFAGRFSDVKSFVERKFWTSVAVEDNAFALMRTNEGVVATLHSSATQWRHLFKLELYLQKGFVAVDGILSASGSYGTEVLSVAITRLDDNGFPLPNPELQEFRFLTDNSWSKEVNEFYDCVAHGKPVVHGTSQDAADVMALVEEIYRADPAHQSKIAAISGGLENA